MDYAFASLTDATFAPFVALAEGVVQTLRDMAVSMTEDITQGGLLDAVLIGISATLRVIVTAVDACIMMFKLMWNSAELSLNAIKDSVLGLAKIVMAFFEDVTSGSIRTWPALHAAAQSSIDKIAADFKDASKSMMGDLTAMGEEMKKLWADWFADGTAAIDGVKDKAKEGAAGAGEGGAGAGRRSAA